MVLGIYFLITLLMLLDLVRVTAMPLSDIPAYFAISVPLGLMQAVFLLAAAQGIYFSSRTTYGSFLGELAKRRGHAVLFGAFVALVVVAVVFGNFIHPVASKMIVDFAGNRVPSTSVDPGLLALTFGLFGFFLVYPTSLMAYASSRVAEKRLRGSLLGLSVAWGVVSGVYVVTEAYMWAFGVDATGLMYLFNAVLFYAVIRNFRRSASIGGFVEKARHFPRTQARPVRDGSMSDQTALLAGKKVLYQVDPDLPYEVNMRRTLEELDSAGHSVYVFTSRSSPLHEALAGAAGAKFFLTTSGVSYMKVADETKEVLLPQSDTAIFLDVADKTIRSKKEKLVFVFDSVTDLLLINGMEETYKFLKQFLELLHEPRSTAFFLLIAKAHEAKDVNLLRGIFSSHFIEDGQGPRVAK